jgi:hypothetical protein
VRKVVLYTLMSLDGAVDQPDRYFTPSVEPGRPIEFDSVMIDNEAKVIGAQDAVRGCRRRRRWGVGGSRTATRHQAGEQ